MPRQHYFGLHFLDSAQCGVEILYLEPEQEPVAVRLVIGVADPAMMVFHVEAVQLKDQAPIRDKAFVLSSAMRAPASEQLLIPPAARLDVAYRDEWLRTHAYFGISQLICHGIPKRSTTIPKRAAQNVSSSGMTIRPLVASC